MKLGTQQRAATINAVRHITRCYKKQIKTEKYQSIVTINPQRGLNIALAINAAVDFFQFGATP